MSASLNIPRSEPSLIRDGAIWNRLHSEREEVCEALLHQSQRSFDSPVKTKEISKEEAIKTANWHLKLLQSRLRKIDDALMVRRWVGPHSRSDGLALECG
jgi:hypothetical protein